MPHVSLASAFLDHDPSPFRLWDVVCVVHGYSSNPCSTGCSPAFRRPSHARPIVLVVEYRLLTQRRFGCAACVVTKKFLDMKTGLASGTPFYRRLFIGYTRSCIALKKRERALLALHLSPMRHRLSLFFRKIFVEAFSAIKTLVNPDRSELAFTPRTFSNF
jgi:hypothetical protein